MYTLQQIQGGEGVFTDRPTRIVSWDDGKTWATMELSEVPGGEPTDCYTVPAGGGWDEAV